MDTPPADAFAVAAGIAARHAPPSPADLAAMLARNGSPADLPRGAQLFTGTRAGGDLCVVRQGAVTTSLATAGGGELITGLFTPGDVFALPGQGAIEVVTAIQRAQLSHLPLGVVEELAADRTALQGELARLANGRVADLQQHLLMLARRTALQRVAGFLLEVRRRQKGHSEATLRLPLSLEGMGAYLGLSLETVCRKLRQLEREGVIRRRRRLVDVLDRAALAEAAERMPPGSRRRRVVSRARSRPAPRRAGPRPAPVPPPHARPPATGTPPAG